MNRETASSEPETLALSASSLFKRQKPDAKTRRKNLIFNTIVLVIAAVLIYFFAPNPFFLCSDVIRNWIYQTPPAVEQLVLNLRLTDQGKFVFGAVDPQIETQAVFNSSCPVAEESASSLGCYDPVKQKVHIYNVESEELAGEIEATAAHELLHAAWDRLSTYDRARLEPLLLEVYNSDEYHEMLVKSTADYSAENFLTELHSQIAERIKDLPSELEKHYAKYFLDQDLIVTYFEQYSSVFSKLVAEAEALAAEIDADRAETDRLAAEYQAWADDYGARVDQFNACAVDPECALANFDAQASTLIAEGKRLDAAYDAYVAAIDALNEKIDRYNSSVVHLQTLDRAMDSRSSPEVKVNESNNN